MARIPMTGGFTLCPEGEHVFYIHAVTYDEEFGKLEVKMVNAQGIEHREKFSLKNKNGELNDKALSAFSFFAKTALNQDGMEDIDPSDLVGHYIRCTVIHTQQPSNKDPGKMLTFANLDRDKEPADGFDTEPCQKVKEMIGETSEPDTAPAASGSVLDDLLGD